MVKLCAVEVAQLICGKDAELQITQIPISSIAVHDQIKHMSEDIYRKWWNKYREAAKNMFAFGWINCCFKLRSTSHFCSVDVSESHERKLCLLWISKRNETVDITGVVKAFLDFCSLSWDLVVLPPRWENFRIPGFCQKDKSKYGIQ